MEVKSCIIFKEQSSTSFNNEVEKTENLKSLELLKKKMCRSHDLIQSYNDKYKECEQLKISLRKTRGEANEMKINYNITLSKLIKQELQNTEHRKSLDIFKKTVADYKSKIEADQQLIQQLTCKIEDNDVKSANKLIEADLFKLKLEEKIKNMEQEIKSLKKSRNNQWKRERADQSVNTDEVQIIEIETNLKFSSKECSDSINSTKEKPSSILCRKCDIAFEKLLNSFEKPEPLIKPFVEPVLLEAPQFYSNANVDYVKPISNCLVDKKIVQPQHLTDLQKHSDSEKIKVLEERLKDLERKMKKNKNKNTSQCCHSNSYFPNPANQNLVLEICKKLLDKNKSQNHNYKKILKRCKNEKKSISKKRDYRKILSNWSIESTDEMNEINTVKFSTLVNQNLIDSRMLDNVSSENLSNRIQSSSDRPKILWKERYPKKKCNLLPKTEGNKIMNYVENKILSKGQNLAEGLNISSQKSIILTHSDQLQPKYCDNTDPLKKADIFSTKNFEKKIKISSQSLKTKNELNDLKINNLNNKLLCKDNATSKENESKELDTKSNEANSIDETVEYLPSTLLRNNSFNNIDKIVSNSDKKSELFLDLNELKDSSLNQEELNSNIKTSEADENLRENDFVIMESINDQTTAAIQERKMPYIVKGKEDYTDKSFDNIDFKTSSFCEKSDKSKSQTFDSSYNFPVFMDSCENTVSKNSSKCQSLESIHVQDLLIKSDDEDKVLSENLEKRKEILKMNSKDFEKGIENLEEIRFKPNEEQSLIQQNERETLEENILLLHSNELMEREISISNTVPPVENNKKKKFQSFREEDSKEKLSISNSMNLLNDLCLSDDEPNVQGTNKFIYSPLKKCSECKKEKYKPSNIFISSTDNTQLSKNFIHGKRSSDLLLTVISPKSNKLERRKNKVEVVKNLKSRSREILLSKIKKLKNQPNKIVSTPIAKKLEDRKGCSIVATQSNSNDNDALNSYIPSKKQRIAHVPRAADNSPTIEISIKKSLRSTSKLPGNVTNFNERIKHLVENAEDFLTDKLPEKRNILNDLKPPVSPAVRKRGRPRKIVKPLEEIVQNEKLADVNFPGENLTIEEITVQNSMKAKENSESTLSTDASTYALPNEETTLSNRIATRNEYWRTAMAALSNFSKVEKDNKDFCGRFLSRQFDIATKEILETHYVINLLNKNFVQSKSKNSINRSKLSQKRLEKNVQFLLTNLVDSKSWTRGLHLNVIGKIFEMCEATTAAKCIVNFLQERLRDEEVLDKSNTPPAPMMSQTQQKIVTLISGLEQLMPDIYNLITSGINFSLFRLGFTPERCIIEGLARIYTVLARLKKDREKARLLCIDALYCFRLNAIIVVYVVLTCWPEVFPVYNTNPEILPKSMVHIILTMEVSGPKFPKLDALKNLLSAYYQYPRAEYFSKNLAVEFLSSLQEKYENSTDMGIILLAKKEGPDWTYKNIIQGESGLLQMIVKMSHPSPYDAFNLLGKLMRSFPEDDKENYVGKIVEQLCDLLDSDQGTQDLLEGIATALLSVSRFEHYFVKVAKSLLLWKPKQEKLRVETLAKFNFFFQSHPRSWWQAFIKEGYKMPFNIRKKNFSTKSSQLNKMPVQKRIKKFKMKKENSQENIPSTSK